MGDDPIKASTYALANLKIVAANLAQWTATEGENYADLEELYGELSGVWSRFSGHVVTNIGGIYELLKTTEQTGVTYTHLAKSDQQKAMNFLNANVFSTPSWLLQKNILTNIEPNGAVERVRSLQVRQLAGLLRMDRLKRIIDNEALNGKDAYTLTTMLSDLRKGLWNELIGGQNIDPYRRNLQRAHVELLAKLIEEDKQKRSDVSAAARAELKIIQGNAKAATNRYRTGIERYHLQDIDALVDQKLDVE